MEQNTTQTVIGRTAAKQVLAQALNDQNASLVSVVGRRRIGKTFLIKQVYADDLRFTVTGIAGANMQEQLSNFTNRMERTFALDLGSIVYTNWLDAMYDLARRLDDENTSQRIAIFFDELPWLASARSGFLKAFSWLWNSWAVDRNVVIVICGSAASWMIKKVVRDRGGLHNRITHRIRLEPFTLTEVSSFMKARGLVTDPYQQLQLYMALGGVPFYLDQLQPGESAQQSIERLLFGRDAPLAEEFSRLYTSLFEHAKHHLNVVRTLATKQSGMLRSELAKTSGITSSGTLARVLEELELSGFILRSTPFGKTRKDALYRLIDEYSRFYLRFLDGNRPGTVRFTQLATKPSYRSWAGYAFENVGLRHIHELQSALGIQGIDVLASTYIARKTQAADGVQIDILLDRADRIITLIEAKFTEKPYVLTSAYAKTLREKISRFRIHTGTRKQVSLVLLTTFGLSGGNTGAGVGIVDRVLEFEDLFA